MRSWSCLLAAVVIGTTLLLPVVQNVPIGSMEEDDFEDSSRASNDGSDSQKITSGEETDARIQELERQNHILWGMLQDMKTKMQNNPAVEQLKKDICAWETNRVCKGRTGNPRCQLIITRLKQRQAFPTFC